MALSKILPTHLGNPRKGFGSSWWLTELAIILIMFAIALLVPVIHEDEPRKKNASRRATWDGSRDSSTVDQLLSGSKVLQWSGSSGEPLISCFYFVFLTKIDSGELLYRCN